MSRASSTPPKAWLCKHCGERVDPTMELCWNCGHDREGVAQPTAFVEPIAVDFLHCHRCGYSLKGNQDATACPECGEPMPWQDCPDCGFRASKIEMEHGCPVCKAEQSDRAFESVLDDHQYTKPKGRSSLLSARYWALVLLAMIPLSCFSLVFSNDLSSFTNGTNLMGLVSVFWVAVSIIVITQFVTRRQKPVNNEDVKVTERSREVAVHESVQHDPDSSPSGAMILPWLTRGWGRAVYWLAWVLLVIGVFLFYFV